MEQESPSAATYTVKDYLLAPFGCLISISPYLVFGVAVVAALLFSIVYHNHNIDLWGIGAPDFNTLRFESYYQKVTSPDRNWSITYEGTGQSRFSGLVRHVSPIREDKLPFLTHDILVTSGEFADSAKVKTSVLNHHFQWASATLSNPSGTINLLHTVPKDDSIYRQLLEIRSGMTVTITGREILRINLLNAEGASIYWWADTGCNSLLVTSVEIQE
jgi:hypothetical protein